MTRFVVEHDSRVYTVSPDDPVPPARRYQAILQALLVDELTGHGTSTGIALRTDATGLTPRVGSDGIVGFAGMPTDVLPDLAVTSYEIDFEIRSAHFVTEARRETIPAQATFPDTFDMLQIGDVPLHTRAITIEGRVIEDDGVTRTPVAGAPVVISNIWRTLPTAQADPVEPPNMVAIAAPLYARRRSGIGTLQRREMTPFGAPMRVTDAAAAGQRSLRLFDSPTLVAGDIIEIEFEDATLPQHDPTRTEHLLIDAIDRVSPALPTTLTLAHDLAFRHAEGIVVRRVTPQAPGPALPLSRTALPTEECVFLTNLAGLAGASVVEITGDVDFDGNVLAPEYHGVSAFGVTTDADGFYRFPPLSRVAQFTVEATVGPDTIEREFNPEYTQPVNRCDLIRPV